MGKSEEELDEQKGERNQREIALFGIGQKRKTSKKHRKTLINDLFKAILEQSDDAIVPTSEAYNRFRNCSYFDKWLIGSQLVKRLHLSLKKNQIDKMPPRQGIAYLVDLLMESGNLLAILELVSLSIPAFRSLETQAKRKSIGLGY